MARYTYVDMGLTCLGRLSHYFPQQTEPFSLNVSPGRVSDPEPYKNGEGLQRTVADPEVA